MRVVLGRRGIGLLRCQFLSLDLSCLRSCRRCVKASGSEVAFYIDTSALVKLVVAEAESAALRSWLMEGDRALVACDLARTELMRAVRRAVPDRVLQARAVLDAVTLVGVSTAGCEEAGRIEPVEVRSLDAVHLAAALDLGDDLEGLVTYDDRLAEAAASNGVTVVMPQ